MISARASYAHTSAGAIMYRLPVSHPSHESQQPVGVDRYTHTLIGPIAEGWSLVMPITLTIERDEEGAYLASEALTTVYGYGESGPEAIRDYIESLIDYYDIVNSASMFESLELGDKLRRILVRQHNR